MSKFTTLHILEHKPRIETHFTDVEETTPSLVISSEDKDCRLIVSFTGSYSEILEFTKALRTAAFDIESMAAKVLNTRADAKETASV